MAHNASQCTYRCVVLPDGSCREGERKEPSLNAPTGAWCSLTRQSRPGRGASKGLNAPTGAWCSLTSSSPRCPWRWLLSQCTYRCVVLPDLDGRYVRGVVPRVSMHLQVRGAP